MASLDNHKFFGIFDCFLAIKNFLCQSRHAHVCQLEDLSSSSSSSSSSVVPSWRSQSRMKTGCLAMALCLKIGVDSPEAIKTPPYSRIMCWIDHSSVEEGKAQEEIALALCKQYEQLQTKALIRHMLNPSVDDLRKFCTSCRLCARRDRVLFHYNGHGVQKPTADGAIWVYNETLEQCVQLPVHELDSWLKTPSIYVFDCSAAGSILNAFVQFYDDNPSSPGKDFILFAACQANEDLPQREDLPADLFTSCLTTTIKMALRWLFLNSILSDNVDLSLIDKILGSVSDRKTLLGELNWIFSAAMDIIAWDVLPLDLFQKLFREDPLVANLFRNFFLAERILRSVNCSPVTYPLLPPTHHHRMWDAWDMAAEISFSSFIKDPEKPFQPSSFFEDQLTALEVSLNRDSTDNKPVENLPIIVWTLPSRVHQLRALTLLCRFLDFGAWAVNMALSVGIFPCVLKMLRISSLEEKQSLLFIWTKILAFDKSCQVELVKNGAHVPIINFLNNGEAYPEQLSMAAFILSVMMDGYRQGQEACLRSGLMHVCLRYLQANTVEEQEPLFLQWLCLCLGKLWEDYSDSQVLGLQGNAEKILAPLLSVAEPEVRASAVFAIGILLDGTSSLEGFVIEDMIQSLLSSAMDGSPLVRYEAAIALARFAYVNKEDIKSTAERSKQYNPAAGQQTPVSCQVDNTELITSEENFTGRKEWSMFSSPTNDGLLRISEFVNSSPSSDSETTQDQHRNGILSSLYDQCILSFRVLSRDPSKEISKIGNTILELIGIVDLPTNMSDGIRAQSSSFELTTGMRRVCSGSRLGSQEDLDLVDLVLDSGPLLYQSSLYSLSSRRYSNPLLNPTNDDNDDEVVFL